MSWSTSSRASGEGTSSRSSRTHPGPNKQTRAGSLQEMETRPLDSGQLTALIHFYRAEVGRLTTYRQRLDTTTNWSITSSALVTTFSLGNAAIPHAAFLFLMLINVFFLAVEARRFKVYEAARYGVLLLERYFYPAVLGDGSSLGWRVALIEALRTPYSYPLVGELGALGWRLRRNYLWIDAAVLLTWRQTRDSRRAIGRPDRRGGHWPFAGLCGVG